MNYKKYLPHIVAILILIAASLIYFSPILKGKALPQSDMLQFPSMSKALSDNKKMTGHYGEWTPNLFSGMPSYQIMYDRSGNVLSTVSKPLSLFDSTNTIGVFFLLALGFYVFMICMGVSPWLSLFAGLIYALGSYNIILIDVGHITKAWAMAMMAPVLAGMILTFRKKYLAGFLVFTISLGLQLTFNHIQITYYTLLAAIVLAVSYLVFAIKDKQIKEFSKGIVVLLIGAILSVLPLTGHLLVNNEYLKHTMRGGSELTVHPQKADQNTSQKGLDINYAFNWSYGKGETMTLLIPDYMGGGSADTRISSQDSKQLQNRINAIRSTRPIEQNQQVANQVINSYLQSTYHGEQPFTAGPVYFGAIVIFLALLGFLTLDNKWRWWLLAATILSIILSWGSNFMSFNSWLFYHLPLYNKFRTPSMALVIANVTMCITAILGLKSFLQSEDKKKKAISLYISMAVVGGICLLAWLSPTLFSDFTRNNDQIFAERLGKSFVIALQEDREAMFQADALRSFIFILLSFAILLLYNLNKIKKDIIVVCLVGVLAIIDLWGVDRRYINNDSYRSKTELTPYATNVENNIMTLTEENKISHFRVYDLSKNTFNDASTSYFLPSIGGYSAVKLQRYQDLIDFYLTNTQYKQKDIEDTMLLRKNPVRQLYYQYRNNPNIPTPNLGVLNMLDARYIILSSDNFIENTEALGSAWFVSNIKWAKNADEEILALDNLDTKTTAVVNNQYKDIVKTINNIDSTATIEYVRQFSDDIGHLTYKTKSSTDQIMIFSEIFYKDSWHAYIDGKEVPYFCANYVLRGLYVPKGNHTIEFVCHSNILKTGNTIAWIGSILLILSVVGAICYPIYKKKREQKKSNQKTSKE